MNDFFHKWSSTAENYHLKVAQVNLPHYRGRGSRPKFISKPTQAPPANEFSGAATTRLLSLLKLQRRLQQLQKKNPEPCLDSLASLQLTALKIHVSPVGVFFHSMSCQTLDQRRVFCKL
jgi:hypothetical protein